VKALFWLLVLGGVAAVCFTLWAIRRREMMRQRESEARGAALLAEALEAIRSKSRTTGSAARD
jgi:membrane protein required for beta-lactamase induction